MSAIYDGLRRAHHRDLALGVETGIALEGGMVPVVIREDDHALQDVKVSLSELLGVRDDDVGVVDAECVGVGEGSITLRNGEIAL